MAVKKKAPAKSGKGEFGEGNYKASRKFLSEQSDFVKKNKGKIGAMGKAAKTALEGAEGASLRAAEAKAKSKARPSASKTGGSAKKPVKAKKRK